MATYEQVYELADRMDKVTRSFRLEWFIQAAQRTRTLPEHRGKNPLIAYTDEIFSAIRLESFDSYAFICALNMPIRDMPLLLVVKDPYVRVVAKWRLGVGE